LILQAIDDAAQALFVLQQSRDVVKKNPRFGKVGDFANELFEVIQKLLRAKGTQLLHGSFPLFNPANLGHAGSQTEKRRQFPQLGGRAGRVDLDAAVVFVTNPAANADISGALFDEPAESNTLDSPGDEPSPRLNPSVLQWADSAWRADSESWSTRWIA
jgi:hypothetical protein